jgi:hypothetical protein
VKTRLLVSASQQSAHNDMALIRKIRRASGRQYDIAHCRYGTTFSHSLDPNRTWRPGVLDSPQTGDPYLIALSCELLVLSA